MRKRMISVSLVLCLAISLAVPAYAAENSVSSKMEKDYEAMEAVYIDLDSVSVHSTENGVITYAYQLGEHYTDYITIQHNDDGSSILDIRENDCHNTMTVLNDGTILIDGEKLVPPVVYSSVSPEIMPRVAFSYAYSSTPFGNTTASQYNVGTYTQNCPSIPLANQLKKIAASVVGTLLANAFFPGNPVAKVASKKVCKEIADKLKSKAATIAEAVNALSFKMTISGHPNNDSFTFYRQYSGKYYFHNAYLGDPLYHTFYELRTTQS